MSDEIDEMSPDLRALLDTERDRPGPSVADRDALRAGLGSLLDGGPGGGGGSDGGTPATPPAGGVGGAGSAAAAGGSALGKLAAVFLAGALAGGAVVWTAAPRTVVVERVTTPAPVVSTASEIAPSATPSIEIANAPPPSASVAKVAPIKSAPAASAEKRDEDLASERALLERARVALGRGDATGALEALDRHSARHPSGRLAEEREVLAVQALVSAGRKDEAQARAARFHREHPSSAFKSAINALVR